MPSAVKRPVKRVSKKAAAALPENRTPSEIVADEILTRYSDLAPSVRRIMESGLGEPGQLHAITAFQNSLDVPGDPMRSPVNAIAAGREVGEVGEQPE
jgi:hypothetical protein